MRARRCDDQTLTVEYGVIHATVPCSVALFTCSCGGSTVEFDLMREAPNRWSLAADGSPRCPGCTAAAKVSARDG